jgi:LacI family transcriptional regulator
MTKSKALASGTKNPRMIDVAALAGVSTMTVSGVFRGAGDGYSVAPATRERVLAAARQLNYRPNGMARAMRRQRFGNVGLLVSKPPRYLWLMPASLAGVFDGLNERGYHLTFIGLPPTFDPTKDTLPKSFQEETIDALIVDGTLGVSADIQPLLDKAFFPIVRLNHKAESNSVWLDDEQGAREAALHVLAKGYRRPAFFSFSQRMSEHHYSFGDRKAAFFRVMSEAGVAAREIKVPDRPEGHAAAQAALAGPDRPDVLFCYGDHDAVFVQRALGRLGLRVPQDIGIITFKGDVFGFSTVELTMMDIPWYEMGRSVVDMALSRIDDPSLQNIPSICYQATLSRGGSLLDRS